MVDWAFHLITTKAHGCNLVHVNVTPILTTITFDFDDSKIKGGFSPFTSTKVNYCDYDYGDHVVVIMHFLKEVDLTTFIL